MRTIIHVACFCEGHPLNFYTSAFCCREDQRIEDMSSPSPIDDILNQSSSNSDIPGWKTANQELAAILTNLRKTEHRIHSKDN